MTVQQLQDDSRACPQEIVLAYNKASACRAKPAACYRRVLCAAQYVRAQELGQEFNDSHGTGSCQEGTFLTVVTGAGDLVHCALA